MQQEFDYVLIAVASPVMYREVKEYLLACGIEKTKIVWVGEKAREMNDEGILNE